MPRRLVYLATLVLAVACAAPEPSPPAPLPTATPAPTLTPSAAPTLSTAEICAELNLQEDVMRLRDCVGSIKVGVRARDEAFARELLAKYGDAIELEVGFFPYPPPSHPQRECLGYPQTVDEHSPLTATVVVDGVIVAGTWFRGRVRVTNSGTARLKVDTAGAGHLVLFRPGESEPIGDLEYAGWESPVGPSFAAGATIEVETIGGSASCDLSLGYVLPAATYEARALVYFHKLGEEAIYFWSDPTVVEVVDE